jgi:hypothetical protein
MYIIEVQCSKCERCNFTGWRQISSTEDKKQVPSLKKYWRSFFQKSLKIRSRKIKG